MYLVAELLGRQKEVDGVDSRLCGEGVAASHGTKCFLSCQELETPVVDIQPGWRQLKFKVVDVVGCPEENEAVMDVVGQLE